MLIEDLKAKNIQLLCNIQQNKYLFVIFYLLYFAVFAMIEKTDIWSGFLDKLQRTGKNLLFEY